MAAQAQRSSKRVQNEEAKLAKLNEELRLDMMQAAVDVAGVVDPTPISDRCGFESLQG